MRVSQESRMRFSRTFAVAIVAACVATGAMAQDKSWKTIRIATEGAYAPYNFVGPDGKLQGFEVDLAHELCNRMSATCEVMAQDWDGIIPALQAGKYDAIMAGMNITDKRKEVIDFSRAYTREANGLGAELSGPLGKLPDSDKRVDLSTDTAETKAVIDHLREALKGKTVGVQVSTIHANFVDKYLKGAVEVREYKTTEQHDLDLLAGRVDAIFASNAAERTTFEKPDFKGHGLVGPKFFGGVFGGGVGVGLRKTDPELKAKFDKAIGDVLADGTLKTLAMKWFKVDTTPQG
jgi:octopine/nopaline transport system substrate-binding protein